MSRRTSQSAALHLVGSGALGLGFFVLPVPVDGTWTVAFDVFVKALVGRWPAAVGAWCLALVALGAIGAIAARRDERFAAFRADPWLTTLRGCGLMLAVLLYFELAPPWLAARGVGGLMWGVLVASVGVIVPLGAAVLNVLVGYGMIELLGTWMRPVMRPVFRLPGRAALDDLMSWLGSYSVGLYVTRKLVDQGKYTRREAFLIATGFSTVSVGFVGVVCSTLDLLHLFPVVFGTYFVVVYALAALQARIWPAIAIPDETVVPADPEPEVVAGQAWAVAMERARVAPPVWTMLRTGFVDGVVLAATILGTILAVGTGATALAEYTPVFSVLGAPLVPVIGALGLPDAELLAPAVLAGITEMYIPALLVRDAAIEGRFFIAVLSISQLVFFSSVAPMMLDLFKDVPIRVGHLLVIFSLRTALLVPVLAAVTHLLAYLGVFAAT